MGKTKYIDADKLAIDLQHRCDVVCPYTKAQRDVMCRACLLGDAIDTVEDQLAADVVEVRHGRWIAEDNDGSWSSAVCSVCGRRVGLAHYETDFVKHFPYCHCGAKMDEVKE